MDILPGAQLAEIDGPHLMLQTRAPQCAAVVLQFIRSLQLNAGSG